MKPVRKLRSGLKELVFSRYRQDLRIDELRSVNLPVYVGEGYGGRSIDRFPPYGFFALHLTGRQQEATDAFRAWYAEQFQKYVAVPKYIGGLHMGSLHRLVIDVHRKHGIRLLPEACDWNAEMLDEAIAMRVAQRFELLDAIKVWGYDQTRTEDILASFHDGHIYLRGGHHRAAILRALGESVLPGVVVLSQAQLKILKRLRAS